MEKHILTDEFINRSKLFIYPGKPLNAIPISINESENEKLFWRNTDGDLLVVVETVAKGKTGKTIVFTNPEDFKEGYFVCRKPNAHELNAMTTHLEKKNCELGT